MLAVRVLVQLTGLNLEQNIKSHYIPLYPLQALLTTPVKRNNTFVLNQLK